MYRNIYIYILVFNSWGPMGPTLTKCVRWNPMWVPDRTGYIYIYIHSTMHMLIRFFIDFTNLFMSLVSLKSRNIRPTN